MSKEIDAELEKLYGVRLTESDPREFAKYHRLAAFDLGEVLATNATVSKFVTLPHPIHQGLHGANMDCVEMGAAGVLGWRVPALGAEIAVAKYELGKAWFGRRKFGFAVFVSDCASWYLAARDVPLDAAAPMVVRGLNGLVVSA